MTIFHRIFKKIFTRKVLQQRGIKILLVAFSLNVLFGILFYMAESKVQQDLTLLDAIWWAMVTMTTVGYGDFYPQTAMGRFLISYPCMLLGIGIIGYLVGVVAENVVDRIAKKKRGLLQLKLKNHIIICNFPHTEKILRLMDELQRSYAYRDRPFVLVTDAIQELPEELKKREVKFVQGDPVREDVLMRANVTECAGVFVLARDPGNPNSDEKTFAIGTIIEMIERDVGRPIKVVVELVSKENLKMMQRSRVDGIVSADGIMDSLLVQEFLYPGVHDIVHQIITNAVGSQFYIFDTKLQGKKFGDVQLAMLEHPIHLQLIGVSRDGQNILSPPKDLVIQENDRLIILADRRQDFETVENDLLKESCE